MKIVNIIGGLGNQMFQYAFAIVLKKCNPDEDVFIDIQHFNYLFLKRFRTSNLHNGYELDKIFTNDEIQNEGFKELVKVTYYMPNFFLSRLVRKILPKRNKEYVAPLHESQTFCPELLKLRGDMYYEGYWQSAKYYEKYRDEIIKAYTPICPPNAYNKRLIEQIVSCPSVGIHIRRGDYLLSPTYSGICDLAYYKKAIQEINSDGMSHKYFIFSNDIKWCKENILPLTGKNSTIFVTDNKGENSCWDIFLMTYCNDLIIANSSFSWWGAFLNQNAKRIIAPKPWMNGRNTDDLYSSSWLQIS